jgi:phosphohistidine phosphatase SixA/8-oxo-dGTP pyrophosphatase MutT (NUDIX family)
VTREVGAETREVRAAGGVVWRENDRVPAVALIHRERYDDWTLPKGKLNEGESELRAAVREVAEETGARVAVTRRLTTVSYTVEENVPKTVAFWAMRYVSGDFAANDEVDDLRWLSLPVARTMVSYDIDRSVLDSFTAVAIPQAVVALVRHAKAGRRDDWTADDRLRPLNVAGREQASKLAAFLEAFVPERLCAADQVRCIQTLEPLAQQIGLEVETVPALSDEAYLQEPDTARAEALTVAKSVASAVICSQGTAVPALVHDLAGQWAPESPSARKGSVWLLSLADGETVSADYYPYAAY